MKPGQKSKRNGYEDILFPMEYCNVTQGDFEGTHAGTYAADLAGRDSGRDLAYFPFSAVCKATNPSDGNAVWWQSQNKVRFADGTIDYCTIMILHDNNLNGIYVGAKYGQGEQMAQEGTAGNATGNHLHFEIAKGAFNHQYDQNSQGIWHLPNNMAIENACFIDNTVLMGNCANWSWKKTGGTSDDIIRVGDTVRIDGVFTIDALHPTANAIASTGLAGKPFADYNYVDSGPCIETDAKGNRSGDQIFYVGEYFIIPGTFTVLAVDIPTDSCYLQIGNRKTWLSCGPCTKIK